MHAVKGVLSRIFGALAGRKRQEVGARVAVTGDEHVWSAVQRAREVVERRERARSVRHFVFHDDSGS